MRNIYFVVYTIYNTGADLGVGVTLPPPPPLLYTHIFEGPRNFIKRKKRCMHARGAPLFSTSGADTGFWKGGGGGERGSGNCTKTQRFHTHALDVFPLCMKFEFRHKSPPLDPPLYLTVTIALSPPPPKCIRPCNSCPSVLIRPCGVYC